MSTMQTHVEYDPREGTYSVWAWFRKRDQNFAFEYGPIGSNRIGLRWDEDAPIPQGEGLRDTRPTLVLEAEIVEALVAAHEPGLNPRNALGEHLKDARAVRDRLLALIERQTA